MENKIEDISIEPEAADKVYYTNASAVQKYVQKKIGYGVRYDSGLPTSDCKEDEKSNVASQKADDVVEKTKLELESLQARAIFSLVETIEVGQTPKKLLYLTNNQASMVDLTDIEKFLIAFDIPVSGPLKPKLIINFFQSDNFLPLNSFDVFGRLPRLQPLIGEISPDNILESEEKALLFLKRCILPLAVQTNAIVIIASAQCVLSRLMSSLCEVEAGIRRNKLPFVVIQFSAAYQYWKSSERSGTLANAFKSKSKRWADQDPIMKGFWFQEHEVGQISKTYIATHFLTDIYLRIKKNIFILMIYLYWMAQLIT
jgi:hypothetical protein